MDKNDLIEVGMFKNEYNQKLGINLPIGMIYQSKGLAAHMIYRIVEVGNGSRHTLNEYLRC